MIPASIVGVHNYCDHWCERCRFQTRCAVFQGISTESGAQGPEAHPISVYATAYLRAVRLMDSASDSSLGPPDQVLAVALDTVRRLSLPLGSKSRRAVHEIGEGADQAGRLHPRGIQSDGNGSAKVARLIVRESIEAWRVIDDCQREAHPMALDMIRVLEALDAELDHAFPLALAFVRPGFDE